MAETTPPASSRSEVFAGAPEAPTPEGVEAARQEIRAGLDADFIQQFRHLLTGFALLTLVVILNESVKAWNGVSHFLPALIPTFGVFVLLRVFLARWSPPRVAVHLLGVLVITILLLNGLAFVHVQERYPSAVPLAFVLVTAGALFLSPTWYVLTLAGSVTFWMMTTVDRIPGERLDEYAVAVTLFIFLSAMLFLYRFRMQTHLESLRLKDEKQRVRLKQALSAAHAQLEERKTSEFALRESEERYRYLVERSPLAIILHDTRRITFANTATARLIGLKEAEECIGLEIDKLIHPESVPFLSERARFLRETGQATPPADIRIVGVDGVTREVEVMAQPVALGGRPMVQAMMQNVTERRMADRALRESEERYRLLAENVTDGIWTSDINLNFDYFSPSVSKIMGMPLEEALRVPFHKMLTPDSVQYASRVLAEEIQKVRAQPGYQASTTLELEMIRGDGSTIWVEITSRLLTDENGELTGVQGVTRDISERKSAEKELRRSEERYRLLAENITDGIWIADLDLKFTYFSPSVGKIFKIPVEQALQIPVEKMTTPDSLRLAREVLAEQVDTVRRFGPSADVERTLEMEFIRGDGVPVWTEVKSKILCDAAGNPATVLGVTRDITARRQAEESLRRSEERLRLLAEHATDVIFTSDLKLNFTFLSPAASRLFGYEPEEIGECNQRLLLTPDSLKIVEDSLEGELEKERDPEADPFRFRTFELQYLTRDGSAVWTEVRVSFLRDEEGRPTGLVGVIRDISERLHAEEERKKLESQLAQAQKLEAVGNLAGGIAHDFNNLLTGILGYADLLKLESNEGETVYESAEVIQTAATRARELTGQLLGFARKGKHRNAPLDLNHTVQEVVSLLNHTFDKNIEIQTDLAAGEATILGDPTQLQQVVLNLAINARDAMPEGGILRFETRLQDALNGSPGDMLLTPEGSYVTLSISDTGCGIPVEIQGRIFEPFFTTKDPGKGTGMGLAMVYGIVKNHGGFLEVRSEDGKGSEFQLRFPAISTAEILPPVVANGKPVKGCGHILIIDDEAVVRRMAGDMMRYLGYEVTCIGDSREAVEFYREHYASIDLVMIDMIMPGLGGRECFQAMKEINPAIRAVLSTGYGQDSAVQKIIDEGVQGFIQKPYEVDDLSQMIARVLVA